MSQPSPTKVKVSRISQVAIAVHDLPLVVENYWSILGIGPWNIYDWEYPGVYQRTYRGRPAWAREKICHAVVGGVEFELMQPVDGPSLYRDFLTERGEGIHHLQFLVDDLDETVGILTGEHDFVSLQSGSCGRSEKGCRYNYLYLAALGCIWEVVECPEGIAAEPARRYPETSAESPAKLKVPAITEVAIAVRDILKTAQDYWNILGIGPWAIYDWVEPLVSRRHYRGQPSRGREKVALADVGGMVLALWQPVAGDSIYRDFLAEHGEGLHHIGFSDKAADEITETLAGHGFPTLASGRFGPREAEGSYHYLDVKPLRAIWKLTSGELAPGLMTAGYP
ncbi:MAG: VOC family protein [Dehalococcoidales bacterium]|nr:VOC family protein [Dehalococcoidales bacterium]